ncbi:FAD-dependent monooxygenase [Actinoplanes couchii]|uniref:FAD-dependent oxidoreductase n=1 Tax=Actinoplanes couchii TaxID=403638 RepID=A0ABQ3X8F7_9ACTN|nr:FAD-dependent monooxygenase [Actinoplanes couchii]MDR6320280.1 2-polyprenyl-6-methoxyphenol hydroxylase-like FAD-dependent oxidoreductase [Actinoplanes couchii]GID54705.1 FAD-dependent oxidoreductase [Actinoplanes couchii]
MIDVLIAGAGPAGLMLACELRLAGVGVAVVERDAQRPAYCRGFTLNARSLDLLARRGLAAPLIAEGWPVPHAAFGSLPVTLGLAGTFTGHPYTLGIPQTRVEEHLEQQAIRTGADVRRGQELQALEQTGDAVIATVNGERLRAAYVVGCDGGRSTVRKRAGINFPGTDAGMHWLLGDVELADPEALPYGPTAGPAGTVVVIPRPGYVRILAEDPQPSTPATLEALQSAVDQTLGRHVELVRPRWVSRFGDAARQADRYVHGRVILAGDAAHIHPPAGAIGVNVALDDAFNLGWKLAATVHGTAPDHLLESYHTERHAAGSRVLAATRAQTLLGNAGAELQPLVEMLTRVAAHPDGNRAFAEVLTGLDTRYDMPGGGDHPWVGRLCPDLAPGATDGGPVLLDLSGTGAMRPWSDRVRVIEASCPGQPELRAVLLRPDGHVAWALVDGDDSPEQALRYWSGL